MSRSLKGRYSLKGATGMDWICGQYSPGQVPSLRDSNFKIAPLTQGSRRWALLLSALRVWYRLCGDTAESIRCRTGKREIKCHSRGRPYHNIGTAQLGPHSSFVLLVGRFA